MENEWSTLERAADGRNLDRRIETDLRDDVADFDGMTGLTLNTDFADAFPVMAGDSGLPPSRSRSKTAAPTERSSRDTTSFPARSSPKKAYPANRGPRRATSDGRSPGRASDPPISCCADGENDFFRIWCQVHLDFGWPGCLF